MKMRVKIVETLFSVGVSEMLQQMSHRLRLEKKDIAASEAETLSYFVWRIARWFSIHQCTDLNDERCLIQDTRGNQEFLSQITTMMRGLTFMRAHQDRDGTQSRPWQKGFIQLNTGAISLSDYMATGYGMRIFAAGNLTTDPLENHFSRTRQHVTNPSASQFNQVSKQILVTSSSAFKQSADRNATGESELNRSFVSSTQLLNPVPKSSASGSSLHPGSKFDFVTGERLSESRKSDVLFKSSAALAKLVQSCDHCLQFFKQFKSLPYYSVSPSPSMVTLMDSIAATVDHNINSLRNRPGSVKHFTDFIFERVISFKSNLENSPCHPDLITDIAMKFLEESIRKHPDLSAGPSSSFASLSVFRSNKK